MTKSAQPYQPLHVSEHSEFFIALCTQGLHSYVTLGVRNGDETKVLAAVGKVASHDASICGFYFDSTEAFVKNERFMFSTDKQYEVAYKAYAINYQHYLEFLHYLKQLSLSQFNAKKVTFPLLAYCPSPADPSLLEWGPINHFDTSTLDAHAVNLEQHANIGLFGNTCRHSAVDITKEATKRKDLGKAVSSLFFQKPPLQAVFSAGSVKKATPYFYILPLPPTAFESIAPNTLRIINQLYQRLDEIVLSQQKHPLTIRKFSQLKDLYNNLTRDSKASIIDVMTGIETWEQVNSTLIATHRKSHWISFQTATQKMFANFHREFEALRANPETDHMTVPAN